MIWVMIEKLLGKMVGSAGEAGGSRRYGLIYFVLSAEDEGAPSLDIILVPGVAFDRSRGRVSLKHSFLRD
jgi:hypothetical protein